MNFVDNMRPSTYKVNARWIPAIMIALPGIILLAGMLYKFMPWNSLVQVPLKILSAGASTFMVIGVASIVLFSEKIRNRGKHLEDEYFHKSITFPTTDLLLWSNNEIEPEIKDMLYKAVYRDYGIGLCSREEENNDIEKARRLICSAVNQIRESVKDGRLLIDYNIRYGYYRNILGSANWGMGLAIVCGVLSLVISNVYIFLAELVLGFYFARLLYKREGILNEYSKEYAHRLFSEYMTWSNERVESKKRL